MRLFRTTPGFRKALRRLSPEQKHAAKAAFEIFRNDPFDARLRPHKIQRLSAHYGRLIYAVEIAGDLREYRSVAQRPDYRLGGGPRPA